MSVDDIAAALAWREPAWDHLDHDAWTAEAWHAAHLLGAAIAALRDGDRLRCAPPPPRPPDPLTALCAALGEREIHVRGAWDSGRQRFLGAQPGDDAGLLKEFNDLWEEK